MKTSEHIFFFITFLLVTYSWQEQWLLFEFLGVSHGSRGALARTRGGWQWLEKGTSTGALSQSTRTTSPCGLDALAAGCPQDSHTFSMLASASKVGESATSFSSEFRLFPANLGWLFHRVANTLAPDARGGSTVSTSTWRSQCQRICSRILKISTQTASTFQSMPPPPPDLLKLRPLGHPVWTWPVPHTTTLSPGASPLSDLALVVLILSPLQHYRLLPLFCPIFPVLRRKVYFFFCHHWKHEITTLSNQHSHKAAVFSARSYLYYL